MVDLATATWAPAAKRRIRSRRIRSRRCQDQAPGLDNIQRRKQRPAERLYIVETNCPLTYTTLEEGLFFTLTSDFPVSTV